MKHFYTFSIAMIAMFSSQLLFAQTSSSSVTGLIASRTDFGSSVIDLNNRNGLLNESNAGTTIHKNDDRLASEFNAPVFRIISGDSENSFEANFTAPKSGKAQLSVRTISGQVIYKENISITKGNNSQLIKAQTFLKELKLEMEP